jgi:hypothetical protein
MCGVPFKTNMVPFIFKKPSLIMLNPSRDGTWVFMIPWPWYFIHFTIGIESQTIALSIERWRCNKINVYKVDSGKPNTFKIKH